MVTDIAEQSLPEEQVQMLHVLIKRMLTETDPEKVKMFTEQIRRIASATTQSPKAA
jgi:hypothetical protein